jgi:hypothetical protein
MGQREGAGLRAENRNCVPLQQHSRSVFATQYLTDAFYERMSPRLLDADTWVCRLRGGVSTPARR